MDPNFLERFGRLEGLVEEILDNHLPHIQDDIKANRTLVLVFFGSTMSLLGTTLGFVIAK